MNRQRSGKSKANGQIEIWKAADLTPHSRQAEVFDDLPVSTLAQLVESIKVRGIQTPLEICSTGTVICGHQRLKAAIHLGLLNVPVVVRNDLESLGEEAIFERMIEDNAVRRQLDPLATARAYRALKRSIGRNAKNRPEWLKGDIRDWLAKRFNCSGRTLDRLERLLDLPRPIQVAISNNQIAATLAARLLDVPLSHQEEASRRIVSGETAASVICALVPKRTSRIDNPMVAFSRLVRELERARVALDDKADQIVAGHRGDIETLVMSRDLIDHLVNQVRVDE